MCNLRILSIHNFFSLRENRNENVYKTSALDFHSELHFMVKGMEFKSVKSSRKRLRHNRCVQLLHKIVSVHKKQQ